MLILSRKVGETIIVNDNIEITVISIERDKIRIGIHAPRDIPIFRKELLPIKQEKLNKTNMITDQT